MIRLAIRRAYLCTSQQVKPKIQNTDILQEAEKMFEKRLPERILKQMKSSAEISNAHLVLNFAQMVDGRIPVMIAVEMPQISPLIKIYKFTGLAALAISPIMPILWFNAITLSYASYAFYQCHIAQRTHPSKILQIYKLQDGQYEVKFDEYGKIQTTVVPKEQIRMGVHQQNQEFDHYLGNQILCTMSNKIYSISPKRNVNQQLFHQLW